jgi:phage N-6-adenine-methyltransferase
MTMPLVLFSSAHEWSTPPELFASLDRLFQFELDLCATPENATCPRYFTKEIDELKQDWGTYRVFCNPPDRSRQDQAPPRPTAQWSALGRAFHRFN